MAVELNHTIIHSPDRRESAEFLAGILGLAVGAEYGPFLPVQTGNGVTLDFLTSPAEAITRQHYAFLLSDAEWDAAFARIKQAGVPYWADPHLRQPGEVNHNDGGSGLYFLDPGGHAMEIITRAYGSGG